MLHCLLCLSPTSFLSWQICFVLLRGSVLFLHTFSVVFVISFNLAFLFFTRFLLLTLPAVPCFFSPCFFISVFTPIFLIQKDLDFCGLNNVDWIKKVLGPIFLYLPKPFCQRTVFCGRFIFCCKSAGQIILTGSKGSWVQFIFICRSHSTRELYSVVKLYFAIKLYSAADLYSATDLCFVVDYFYLHFFLWKFLALRSSWWVFGPCFSLGFLPHESLGTDLQKWTSTHIHTINASYKMLTSSDFDDFPPATLNCSLTCLAIEVLSHLIMLST